MKTFFKRIFAGWFILALITFTAYPQGPADLSVTNPQGPASPPGHANPHDGMPAPQPLELDVPATSGPASPLANPAGSARKSHQNKNGSDYFTGSGTAADPWLIATATELDNVRHFVGEGQQDKHFRQTANIDLGVSPWNDGEGWVPVGNGIDPFHGHYDGNGHEVSNLVIARDTIEYQGLFGRNNGTIMNLGVVNAAVTDNGSRAGILVGLNDSGVIDGCYTSGTIQCDHEAGRIGGLAGWNNGTIRHSSSAATVVTTGITAGGLTGANSAGGTLINCFATGDVIGNEQAGGLVGSSQMGGQIISCHATGEVSGTSWVGGLIGIMRAETTTDDCYATGKVRGGSSVGGLVGYVNEATIQNSFFSGLVEGNNRVGGLVGSVYAETAISRCYAEGEIRATGNWVGGLTGTINNSTVTESFAATEVSSTGFSVGGLIGTLENNAAITNAYSTGNVNSTNWLGGLVGWVANSSITNSYSANFMYGHLSGNSGGLVGGSDNPEIIASYWNTETTGEEESAGGEGKTNAEMTAQAAFDGWDFDNTWGILENETYPYLQWQKAPNENNHPASLYMLTLTVSPEEAGTVSRQGMRPEGSLILIRVEKNHLYNFIEWTDADGKTFSTDLVMEIYMPGNDLSLTATFEKADDYEGSGTAEDPWIIATASDLYNVRHFLGEEHQDKHFRQTADIDLGVSPWSDGEGWVPIGANDNAFYGHYDGNDHVVSNMVILRSLPQYQGLFRRNLGVIKNLHVSDAIVTDNGGYAGILAGSNAGTIDHCHTSGIINCDNDNAIIGGLTAWNSGVIRNASSAADVTATGLVAGGLTGVNSGATIINSFATGKVTGYERVGGLSGVNQSEGMIASCYTSGHVTGTSNVGGLVGIVLSGSNIDRSHASGNISGTEHIGGLVGYTAAATIENSFFMGNVEGENRVGGLAGTLLNQASVLNGYSEGEVHATGNWVGGLTGVIDNSMVSGSFSTSDVISTGYTVGGLSGLIRNLGTIDNSYSTGNVVGANWLGGLVGWVANSSITNSYSANFMYGHLSGNSGGLVGGSENPEIIASFWNTETTGEEESTGGEGKTNAEMTAQATFTGWDFDNTWAMQKNETYPYLQWQGEPEAHNHPAGLYLLTLTVSPEEAGTVSRQGMRPEGSLNLINTATNEDYLFIEWTDAGGNTFSTDSTTKFYMPGHDLALTATFHALENTVSIAAAENGHVNPEGEVTVDYGQDLVVTITPDEGYRVAFIRLNGVDINLENDPGWDAASGTFTIAKVVVNQHLEVGFELIAFKLLFMVTDARTGAEIPDATIRLEDSWHEAGIYLFDQMIPGTYSYLVTREGYFEKGGTASISNDDLTEAVALDVDDTGLSNPHLSKLKVYPNPATDEIRIDVYVNHGEKALLQIYNLQGQTVYQEEIAHPAGQTLHVNIRGMQSGIYLLALMTSHGLHVERLVVK